MQQGGNREYRKERADTLSTSVRYTEVGAITANHLRENWEVIKERIEKICAKYHQTCVITTLSSMPECTQTSKKKSYSSSNSSSSGGDSSSDTEDEKLVKEKKVTYDLDEQKYKSLERSSRVHFKPPIKSRPFTYSSPSSSSTPIRRSVSCPRSITALNAQSLHVEQHRPLSSKVSAQVSRPSSGNRTNSLNRSSSSHRVPHTGMYSSMYPTLNESALHHISKDQEEELTRQTLHVLQNMRIRFPGKMDEDETCAIIDEVSAHIFFRQMPGYQTPVDL
ncbi:unnamed protein product [Ranitomeya imitator]|uniref:Uncharacterized protein n=1 Tax=Ranitomeya imitator TaxID=111125 RepID=A0ABN9LI26_9NEOB|nr:unnamed protein product [Ranitomeya imitator]